MNETQMKARIAELEAQLAAVQQGVQPALPEGWKLVPIEATQEMVDAWSSATELPEGVAEQADDVVNAYAARRDWKAMLAASPETKACYAASKPAAQWLVERDEAFEAVRKAFCKLQRYSFFLDSRGNVRRCADHCGNWVEFEAVHTLFEPQAVDAALSAQAKQGGV